MRFFPKQSGAFPLGTCTLYALNTSRLIICLQIWRVYLSLPTALAQEFAEHRKKQKEYLSVRHDLNATSSQDEFAKWARLRRQHDKLLEELEKRSRKPTSQPLACCPGRSQFTKQLPQNPHSTPRAHDSTAT